MCNVRDNKTVTTISAVVRQEHGEWGHPARGPEPLRCRKVEDGKFLSTKFLVINSQLAGSVVFCLVGKLVGKIGK